MIVNLFIIFHSMLACLFTCSFTYFWYLRFVLISNQIKHLDLEPWTDSIFVNILSAQVSGFNPASVQMLYYSRKLARVRFEYYSISVDHV